VEFGDLLLLDVCLVWVRCDVVLLLFVLGNRF